MYGDRPNVKLIAASVNAKISPRNFHFGLPGALRLPIPASAEEGLDMLNPPGATLAPGTVPKNTADLLREAD